MAPGNLDHRRSVRGSPPGAQAQRHGVAALLLGHRPVSDRLVAWFKLTVVSVVLCPVAFPWALHKCSVLLPWLLSLPDTATMPLDT